MRDDLRVFRELILWLWDAHQKPWEYQHKDAKYIVENLQLVNNSFASRDELEANLPNQEEVSKNFGKRYFYLTPVTAGKIMVPRIHLNCDFGRNYPEARCRLELFLRDGDAKIQSLGYRFESPEGKSDEGIGLHHYYHIQLTQPPISKAEISWLPEKQPAFPIEADDSIKMLLALLISLYGIDYLGVLLRDARNVYELDKYIDDLYCNKFSKFEWYRVIEFNSKKQGYQISSNIKDFEAYAQKTYPGSIIKGISKFGYNSLVKKNQKKYPE